MTNAFDRPVPTLAQQTQYMADAVNASGLSYADTCQLDQPQGKAPSMTDTMTETSITDRIARGEFDGQLDEIFEALKNRRRFAGQQQAARNKASMNPGDAVRITSGISPKYLIGVTGTVSPQPARKAGSVQVDIDEVYWSLTAKFGRSVGVPANCLEKTEKK